MYHVCNTLTTLSTDTLKANDQSDRESSFLPFLSEVAQMYGISAMHKRSYAGCALPSVYNIMKLTYSWG